MVLGKGTVLWRLKVELYGGGVPNYNHLQNDHLEIRNTLEVTRNIVKNGEIKRYKVKIRYTKKKQKYEVKSWKSRMQKCSVKRNKNN